MKKSTRGQWLHLHLFHLPFFSILPFKDSFQRNIRLIVQIFVVSSNLPVYLSGSEEIHPAPPGKRKLPTFPLGFPLFNNLYPVQSTRPSSFEGVICEGKSGQFRCRESHTHSSCFLSPCLSYGKLFTRLDYIQSQWKDVNRCEFEGICLSCKYWTQARSYAVVWKPISAHVHTEVMTLTCWCPFVHEKQCVYLYLDRKSDYLVSHGIVC